MQIYIFYSEFFMSFLINKFFLSFLCEGTQLAQSRYLFAISCFQMDLLSEAEAALCPANEPTAEVLNDLHYLT